MVSRLRYVPNKDGNGIPGNKFKRIKLKITKMANIAINAR